MNRLVDRHVDVETRYIHMCVCIYVCTHTYVYVYIYICIYIYIYIWCFMGLDAQTQRTGSWLEATWMIS